MHNIVPHNVTLMANLGLFVEYILSKCLHVLYLLYMYVKIKDHNGNKSMTFCAILDTVLMYDLYQHAFQLIVK